MAAPPPAPPEAPARSLTWATWLLYGEALAVTAVAGWLLYADLAEAATSLLGALLVTAFALGAAALLWFVARALGDRRGGVRGVAVVAQLMFLSTGYYMVTGGMRVVGGVVLAYAGVATVLLCLPPTTRALGLERQR